MPFCCKDEEDKSNLPVKYVEDRSCTDILCLFLFVAFWGGYVAVASVAWANGQPNRLIYGVDYLGYRCGDNNAVPLNFGSTISASSPWQSQVWAENTLLWFPVPQSNISLETILSSGICVKTCPTLTATSLAEIDLKGSSFSTYTSTLLPGLTIATYGTTSVQGQYVYAPPFQMNLYSSEAFWHRCIPSGLSAATLNQTLAQVPYGTEINKFFFRGVGEIGAAWRVFLITFFLALVICFVYVFIMRFVVKILVYIAIILVFALLMLVGAAAYNRYTALKAMGNTTSQSQDYVDFYLAAAIISWVLAVLYVILIIFMRKRISLVCSIIKIAGRVVGSGPFLLVVPIVIGILVLCICAWALSVAVFLYSADDFSYKPFSIPVNNFTKTADPDTSRYFVIGGQWFANATVLVNSQSYSKRDLLFYDLFAFLWTMGFFNAIGFMIVCFTTIFWYYSDLDDAKKAVPSNGVRLSVWWTLRYHLGTLAFGSLIIAIIQFIRFLMNYFYQKAKAVKENQVFQLVFCIANCILACFERIVNVISKNAYIYTAITNKSFCCSAKDAFNMIADNALTIFLLNVLVEVVMAVGKVCVVAGSVLIGYCLMKYNTLAPAVETYILPLICIAFGSYFIAAVFFNVYGTAVDASFVCYCYDRKANSGTGMYYVPAELEEQISNFNKKQMLDQMAAKQQAAHAPEPIAPSK